ncbi:MAG: endonuclease/exonuclease/phosphatase family protein [Luteolibacter sp.]
MFVSRAVSLIASVATLGISAISAAPEKPAATELTVVSLNIRNGGRRMDGVYDRPLQQRVIAALKPDLLAMQEVDRKTTRVGGVDVPAEFSDALALKFHYAPAIKFAGGEYGTATFSKFPITREITIPLPTPVEDRAAALIVTKLPNGGEVMFVSVHLDSSEKSDAARLSNTRALLAVLDKENNKSLPAILAGDFNATPDSPIFKLFADAGFRRCESKNGADLSFPADKPDKLIDFVLLRDGATAGLEDAGTEIVNEPLASDHRPMLSHLRVVSKK